MKLLRSRARLLTQRRLLSAPTAYETLFNPTPEHLALRHLAAKFAKEEVAPQARASDKAGEVNMALMRRCGELGLLGITVPEARGGAGMDAVAAALVHEELARVDAGFALAFLAHTLLFVNNLAVNGTDAQCARYLPKMLTGEEIGCMGMSEAGGGTDVLGMRTTAVPAADGSGYTISGDKLWITNSPESSAALVYATVRGKITAFVIPRSAAGFTVGPKIDKCGMRASTMAPLYFDKVKVPKEDMVGREGGGVVCMMQNLEIERLCLAAMAVGIARGAGDIMVAYATQRRAFGQPICEFGQIQKYIADTFAETEAARCLLYNVAASLRVGQDTRRLTDAAKLFCAPVAKRAADACIQVMGGAGYATEGNAERMWRDAKLLEIGGGTLESHHKNITRDITRSLKPKP